MSGPIDTPAPLQLGITRPDALFDREDCRSAKGRLQQQAVRDGHLAKRPDVTHQFVVTAAGRALLEEAAGWGAARTGCADSACCRSAFCTIAPIAKAFGRDSEWDLTPVSGQRSGGP